MSRDSRKKVYVSVAVIMVAVLVWFMGFKQTDTTNLSVDNKDVVEPSAPALESPEVAVRPPQPDDTNSKTIDEVFGEDLADKFDQVADAYEQSARYPANSQVVRDADLVAPKKPFEESQVDLSFPDQDGGELPLSLSAATEKFQYLNGEKITARLIINGAEENAAISASAIVVSPGIGNISSQKSLDSTAEINNEFRTEFDSQLFPEKGLSSELMIRFTVDVNDQNLVATVPFKYGIASARLDSIPYSRAEGEYLLIPLQFTVFESGYYFVDAILDEANTSRPLVQLQTEGRMSNGNDVLLLRAHQQALKDAGSEGPYTLRVRTAFRGADVNEVADAPVVLPNTGFAIPSVGFAEYEDVQYTDAEVKQRIEFLRGLGNKE